MANNLVEFTDDNFDAEVLKSDLPVLVDFWAEWCGPCNMISPIVEEIASDYNGKVKVVKVNIEFNQQVSITYGITGIPALIFLIKNLMKFLVDLVRLNFI